MIIKSIMLFQIRMNPIDSNSIVEYLCNRATDQTKTIIGHHNFHSVYLFAKDERFRSFYHLCNLTYVDSMLLILWGKFMKLPLSRRDRSAALDWFPKFLNSCSKKQLKIFHLGGKSGVGTTAIQQFKRKFPDLEIESHHGYFDSIGDENKKVIDLINSYKPNILIVGMGMPNQEYWVLDNYTFLSANVILTTGATFDYFAGEISICPRWLGQLGLEWLFRLISEPRRLWRRYLLEFWSLIPLALSDIRYYWFK